MNIIDGVGMAEAVNGLVVVVFCLYVVKLWLKTELQIINEKSEEMRDDFIPSQAGDIGVIRTKVRVLEAEYIKAVEASRLRELWK